MSADGTIIDCRNYTTINNQLLVGALMYPKISLETQIKNVSIFTKDKVKASGILIPRIRTKEFCFFKTSHIQAKPHSPIYTLVKTNWDMLPMIMEEFPEPQFVVDISRLWQEQLTGREIPDNAVYYLIRPGVTALVQHLKWDFDPYGAPSVWGMKTIKLFELTTSSDGMIRAYLHELLRRPSWILAHPDHPDSRDQAVQPDQEL